MKYLSFFPEKSKQMYAGFVALEVARLSPLNYPLCLKLKCMEF